MNHLQTFEIEFKKRKTNLLSVRNVVNDNTSINESPSTNHAGLQSQIVELNAKWEKVENLASARKIALDAALSEVILSLQISYIFSHYASIN